jgi:conjugal transfer/type IV secretion protein DotA/TraY
MGLPAIPLVFWIMGVVNWLISVVALVIGATIWAAAISMPEGEGVAGNHGREGFMLLSNCLLRPFLMVFGFVIAFLLIRCAGFLLYSILSVGLESMSSEYSRGFAVFIGTIAVYAVAATLMIFKIFGFMVQLPDIILHYVGKHLPGGGEGGDVEKMSGGLKSVGQGGGQIIGKLGPKAG